MAEEKGSSEKEQRQLFRLDLAIPVRYRFARKVSPGKYKISPYFKGIGDNFSGGGAAIKVGKPLPEKTLVYLEMTFPFSETPILATGEVMRSSETEFKGTKVTLLMVRYLVMDDTLRDRMTGFIISHGRNVGAY